MPIREARAADATICPVRQAVSRVSTEGRMSCDRCGGFLVKDWVVSLKNDGGDVEVLTFRCIQCGENFDPVVLRNRRSAIARFRGKTMTKSRKLILASSR